MMGYLGQWIKVLDVHLAFIFFAFSDKILQWCIGCLLPGFVAQCINEAFVFQLFEHFRCG